MIAWAEPIATYPGCCTATVCTCHPWNRADTLYVCELPDEPEAVKKQAHREAMAELVRRQRRHPEHRQPLQAVRAKPRVWQPTRA